MSDMNMSSSPIVPDDELTRIFEETKGKIIAYLDKLGGDVSLIGLRIGYDLADSSSEPGFLPYKIEFGNLEPVDRALKDIKPNEPVEEQSLTETTEGVVPVDPLPLEFLQALYDQVKARLEKLAGEKLKTGILIVLIFLGNIIIPSLVCGCGNTLEGYKLIRCLSSCNCTNTPCY